MATNLAGDNLQKSVISLLQSYMKIDYIKIQHIFNSGCQRGEFVIFILFRWCSDQRMQHAGLSSAQRRREVGFWGHRLVLEMYMLYGLMLINVFMPDHPLSTIKLSYWSNNSFEWPRVYTPLVCSFKAISTLHDIEATQKLKVNTNAISTRLRNEQCQFRGDGRRELLGDQPREGSRSDPTMYSWCLPWLHFLANYPIFNVDYRKVCCRRKGRPSFVLKFQRIFTCDHGP